jgi:hypothetical protein
MTHRQSPRAKRIMRVAARHGERIQNSNSNFLLPICVVEPRCISISKDRLIFLLRKYLPYNREFPIEIRDSITTVMTCFCTTTLTTTLLFAATTGETLVSMSGRNVMGTHPYAHPQHIKFVKHLRSL